MRRPLVVADPSIPWVREGFLDLPVTLRLHPSDTLVNRPDLLEDADGIVVPSSCPVDDHLLQRARRLKAIASPVVGREHVRREAVARLEARLGHPVPVFFAPGSTAGGVGDYVAAAILDAFPAPWAGAPPRVGIWGFGRCGQALAARLDRLGIPWVAFDPPREARSHHRFRSATMEDLRRCQVLSLHVPATRPPCPWPTRGLIDVRILGRLADSEVRLLVNTSRGEVLDPRAIDAHLDRGGPPDLVLDVFVGEPSPPVPWVTGSRLATPHVAGSVMEGRWRALLQVRRPLARRLGVRPPPDLPIPPGGYPSPLPTAIPPGTPPAEAARRIREVLPLDRWSREFRQAYREAPPEERPAVFRAHRNSGLRREIRWVPGPSEH